MMPRFLMFQDALILIEKILKLYLEKKKKHSNKFACQMETAAF